MFYIYYKFSLNNLEDLKQHCIAQVVLCNNTMNTIYAVYY